MQCATFNTSAHYPFNLYTETFFYVYFTVQYCTVMYSFYMYHFQKKLAALLMVSALSRPMYKNGLQLMPKNVLKCAKGLMVVNTSLITAMKTTVLDFLLA